MILLHFFLYDVDLFMFFEFGAQIIYLEIYLSVACCNFNGINAVIKNDIIQKDLYMYTVYI